MSEGDAPSGRAPSSVLIQLVELRKDVGILQKHDLEHGKKLSDLNVAVAEHKLRLENGVKVFGDHKKRLESVEHKTTPKPPSIIKIVGLTLGIVGMGAGALWALSNMLRDRPTVEQIDKIIEKHDGNGHKAVRDDIKEIQKAQALQGKDIGSIQTMQAAQSTKIDTLLDRVPERRRRNRDP